MSRETLHKIDTINPTDIDDDPEKATLDYIRTAYDRHRTPETPDWDDLEPRLKKYLKHLFSTGRIS